MLCSCVVVFYFPALKSNEIKEFTRGKKGKKTKQRRKEKKMETQLKYMDIGFVFWVCIHYINIKSGQTYF